jgi:hypothetical protein
MSKSHTIRPLLFVFTLGACGGEIAPHSPDNTPAKAPAPPPSDLVQHQREAERALRRGLQPDQIRSVVMSHIDRVRECYEAEAKQNPDIKGQVVMAWQIDPSGSVPSAWVRSTTVSNPRVEACLTAEVRQWQFAPSETPTTVGAFPFLFGADEPAATPPASTYVGAVTFALATQGAKVILVCNNCRPVQRKAISRFPERVMFGKPDERWQVRATKRGFSDYVEDIHFDGGATEKAITIRLRPKSPSAQ